MEHFSRDTEEKTEEKTEKKTEGQAGLVIREVFSWLASFAFAFLIALLIKNFVIINADVPTGSMENTIMPGDRLIGNRLAYLKEGPKRGDVVIFHYPDDEEDLYVKRVIGLPGETVVIEDAKVYIDGNEEPLAEDYLKEEWVAATGPYTFLVPEDSYLVMGDNRNDSWDARFWSNTYVARKKILGKASVIYWPFKDFGKLE